MKMTAYKTEATLRKEIEEYVAKCGVFKSEELKDLKYNMRDCGTPETEFPEPEEEFKKTIK